MKKQKRVRAKSKTYAQHESLSSISPCISSRRAGALSSRRSKRAVKRALLAAHARIRRSDRDAARWQNVYSAPRCMARKYLRVRMARGALYSDISSAANSMVA